jgi:hypothetical protein
MLERAGLPFGGIWQAPLSGSLGLVLRNVGKTSPLYGGISSKEFKQD